MPILFIALQCCQCSTMQVKQQKKSSNKWTCVVCNQKQSVRKLFAQGFMAKDLREFVQSFNMSRKSADKNSLDETLASNEIVDSNLCCINFKNKRKDWTEYLDLEADGDFSGKDDNEQENVCEMEVVTEMPREMFKKPKLRNNSKKSNKEGGDELFKPVFKKRNSNNHIISKGKIADREQGEKQQTMAMETSKRNNYTKDVKILTAPGMSKGTSKWNHYITHEDDDDLQLGGNEDVGWSNDVFQTMTDDQKIDEDIHPDFMSILFSC